jgi:hypothetical protein
MVPDLEVCKLLMTTAPPPTRTRHEIWEFAYNTFLRLLSIFFIIFAIQAWMKAIGISGTEAIGFDNMPVHWRFAIAALCVLHPVTALGLWCLLHWGVALWLINIFVQSSMYLVFSDLYGYEQNLIIFHICSFGIFSIFHLTLRYTTNRS